MTKIERIRSIIERFTGESKDHSVNFQLYLAKCSRMFELLTQLDELEEIGVPEKISATYEDDIKIFNQQLDSIGEEVRRIIWEK
jgi:hypothetical protein